MRRRLADESDTDGAGRADAAAARSFRHAALRLGRGDFYPRTHWHVNLSYYRDHRRFGDLHTQAFLAQLHLYL